MKLQFLGLFLLLGIKIVRMEEEEDGEEESSKGDDEGNCVAMSVKLWSEPQGIDGTVIVMKGAEGSCPKKSKKSFFLEQTKNLQESYELKLKDGKFAYKFGDQLSLEVGKNAFWGQGDSIELTKKSGATNTWSAQPMKKKQGTTKITYKAPGGVLFMIRYYKFDIDEDMPADVSVKCDDDKETIVRTTMRVKATSYGARHLLMYKGEYKPDACDDELVNCIKDINDYPLDKKPDYDVVTDFRKCFKTIYTTTFY